MTWEPISCYDYDVGLSHLDEPRVHSGRSDLDGQWGLPCVETIWADAADMDSPLFKSVRHPGPGPDYKDRLPCEHYRAVAS